MKTPQWFKSLFDIRVGVPTPSAILPPEPSPPPEPSCFAKGVAELWKRGEGWKVTFDRKTGEATLRHRDLDIVITLKEHVESCPGHISTVGVFMNGNVKIYMGYSPLSGSCARPSWEDYAAVRDAILSHPYPGLKARIAKKAKDEAARAARLKEIEALGCPVAASIVDENTTVANANEP